MAPHETSVVVVGSGFSGLAVAIELKKSGIEDFVVLERAATLGGTWRDNVYPGCACDVPSHLYSFSFAPKHDWSRAYASQEEIRAYLERVCDDFGLREHVLFGRDVVEAEWDEAAAKWLVRTASGETFSAGSLVLGTGALSNPSVPALPGIEQFRGEQFHSARWNHACDLRGKRVAVVGTGASAVQFVPRIQPLVDKLFLLQRTPPWVIPRGDRPYTALEKAAFRFVPGVRWLYRQAIYWNLEGRVLAFTMRPSLMRVVERWGKRNIARAIRDPQTAALVTPDYTPGCKRILLSDDYYPALAQPNVEVIGAAIERVGERSITVGGRTIDVDAIVYGTGFAVHDYVGHTRIRGRGGVTLRDSWKSTGAEAYLGTMVSGFPNLYMMTGPNTGLGHSSIVVVIEGQARYVREAISLVARRGAKAIEPRREVQAAYNEWLRGRNAATVWSSGCRSWYLDSEGRNTTLWPGALVRFRMRIARLRESDHVLSGP